MNRDFRQPILTLLGLFALLGMLIFVFMLTGDTSQPVFPLRAQEVDKLAAPPQAAIATKRDAVPENLRAVQYTPPASASAAPTIVADEILSQEEIKPASLQDEPALIQKNVTLEDGTYRASLAYSDLAGNAAAYTVDVTVLNRQVIAIDCPKLGWMDGDHFKAANIDERGEASFEDDQGRIFEIHIKPATGRP